MAACLSKEQIKCFIFTSVNFITFQSENVLYTFCDLALKKIEQPLKVTGLVPVSMFKPCTFMHLKNTGPRSITCMPLYGLILAENTSKQTNLTQGTTYHYTIWQHDEQSKKSLLFSLFLFAVWHARNFALGTSTREQQTDTLSQAKRWYKMYHNNTSQQKKSDVD